MFPKGQLAIKTTGSENMPKQVQKATTPCAAPMIMNDTIHTPKNNIQEKDKSDKRAKPTGTVAEKASPKAHRSPSHKEKSDPLLDESMCFANKSSLEDYIIGK